jgi:prolyl 4-hydroxylase
MSQPEFPKKIADNVTMYSADPIVYLVSDFLNDEECEAFIDAAQGKLKVSTVISKDKFIQHESRTSENCWLEHDANEIVHEVSKRLSILVQMPIRNAEQYQVVYYRAGTEYKPHYDSFDYDSEEGKENWEPGGQRVLTALAYLNNVDEGGGTGFPNLDVEIDAKKGDVLIFHNTLQGSNEVHPGSLHAGLPVISGEKWAINLWFRERLRY